MQKSSELLNVRKLYVSYGNSYVVRNVNFVLNKGELMGIVGESGCGKSTLLRSLMILKGSSTHIIGDIRYEGMDITKLPQERLRQLRGDQISMIPQNAFCSMDQNAFCGIIEI